MEEEEARETDGGAGETPLLFGSLAPPPPVRVMPYVVSPTDLRRELLAVPFQARRALVFMGSGVGRRKLSPPQCFLPKCLKRACLVFSHRSSIRV